MSPKEKRAIDLHFQAYLDILEDLKTMSSELQIKKENLYNLTGHSYNEIIKSSTYVGVERFIEDIQKLEEMISAKEKERIEKYDDHIIEISNLEDIMQQRIIIYFYLDRLSIEQIATILYLSSPHVKRLKKAAVVEFEKMIPNDTK